MIIFIMTILFPLLVSVFLHSRRQLSSVKAWKVNPYPEPPPQDYISFKMAQERQMAKVKEKKQKTDSILQRRKYDLAGEIVFFKFTYCFNTASLFTQVFFCFMKYSSRLIGRLYGWYLPTVLSVGTARFTV